MNLKQLLLISLFASGAFALYWRFRVARSLLEVSRDDIHFPTVSGSNLLREELTFPQDFDAALNILFVPFLQEQQAVVNTWIPFAQEAEATYPQVAYYELPTIDEMSTFGRTFVNEGMRAGIPDQTARERTVTLYIDTARFMKATDIADKSEVHTLLVNRQGDILWRTTGIFDEAKSEALIKAIEINR